MYYSETSNNGLSERQTTSVQRTNSMPLIAFPIEIVHLEPPRSGHLSTMDKGPAPNVSAVQRFHCTHVSDRVQ